MATLLDLVSNGLWLPIKWTLPGLARVMPRIAVEVEGIHPSLLESLALHQRCSCKWSWWCSSKWTVSMWDMGQAEKQPNHLSASCQLEVSDYPAQFPKRESHSELNDHHRKWVFESATCVSCPVTVCKTCYRVAWKKRGCHEATQRKGSKPVGYQHAQIVFICTPNTVKGLSIFLSDWRIMLLTYNET